MIRGFRIQTILRIIALTISLVALSFLVFQTEYLISAILLAVIVIVQVFGLISYIETTNTKLTRFLEAINYNDFSLTFQNKDQKDTFFELGEAFNSIIEKFKSERTKGEESHRYLETVVQHIGIGLFSYNQEGNIELLNTAAKRLLSTNVLRNVTQLKEIDDSLYHSVIKLKSGSRTLLTIQIESQKLQLAMYATEFRMKGENYKLISLQNISSELDEKEMEAWQNLTQVLAHEIMNSITPIASLSDTVNTMLLGDIFGSEHPEPIPDETLDDVRQALSTINKRSLGLMRFVNSYRNITQLPIPMFEVLPVTDILNRVSNLMMGEATRQRVEIEVLVEPDTLEVTADPQLIEQALINIVKNAFKALAEVEHPSLILRSGIDNNGHTFIDVEDNGPGIKDSVLEKIFVPFYSTNKSMDVGGGSGIGLSLSRQIMRMHGGSLRVSHTEPGKTIFQLRF